MINIDSEDTRLTTFPIHRKNLWKLYQNAQKSYWIPQEVSLNKDVGDFDKLSDKEQHLVKYVLAFFASSDGIVNINIVERFRKELDILEVKYFYDYQVMIENIHAEMYSILIDTIITDLREKNNILANAANFDGIDKITNFMYKCIASDEPLSIRLLRMACVEGIFFTGGFCVIYWLQSKGLMPGLAHSNELISRDECLHTMFSLELYKLTNPKPNRNTIESIINESTLIAYDMFSVALPDSLPEMNKTLVNQYIQVQADSILSIIDEPPLYNKKNPFTFMDQINLQNYTNIFDRRVSEYSKTNKSSNELTITYDF